MQPYCSVSIADFYKVVEVHQEDTAEDFRESVDMVLMDAQ